MAENQEDRESMIGRMVTSRTEHVAFASKRHPCGIGGSTSFGDSLLNREQIRRLIADDSPYQAILDSDTAEAELDELLQGSPAG